MLNQTQPVARMNKSIGSMFILLALGITLPLFLGLFTSTIVHSFNDRSLVLYENEEYKIGFMHPRSETIKVISRDTPLGTEVRFMQDLEKFEIQIDYVGFNKSQSVDWVIATLNIYDKYSNTHGSKQEYFSNMIENAKKNETEDKYIIEGNFYSKYSIEGNFYRKVQDKDALVIVKNYESEYGRYGIDSFIHSYRNTEIYIYDDEYTLVFIISDDVGQQVDNKIERIISSIKLP